MKGEKYSQLESLIINMQNFTTNKQGWNISFSTVNIGCCSNITLKELQSIAAAEKEIKSR